jgi:hypothetical protein
MKGNGGLRRQNTFQYSGHCIWNERFSG